MSTTATSTRWAALRPDLYHWHLYRLALADALPAGRELPTQRPPRPMTARTTP